MNEFMKVLLSLSVSGTLLLLFILGLKCLCKRKLSRRWQYYIWLAVVLRFLIPFVPGSVNVGNLLDGIDTQNMTAEHSVVFNRSDPADHVHTPNVKQLQDGGESKDMPAGVQTGGKAAADSAVGQSSAVHDSLFSGWLVLALVLFVRKITMYQDFIQSLKAHNTETEDIRILNLLSVCAEKLKIKTKVELYRNSMIVSPMMIGFFHPAIILPVKEIEEKELFYIFTHELTHYRRKDMFYKWLVQIVICVHWFNPFVYLLEKEVNTCCELACDEKIISALGEQARREYGDTLLSFIKAGVPDRSSLASVTLTEGAQQLKERLGEIMNYRRKTRAVGILTGILTVGIIFGAAFAQVYPVAAAADGNAATTDSVKTGKTLTLHKSHGTGVYIYDENTDWDFDWANEDWDFDWASEDWNFDDDFAGTYGSWGLERDGKSIYYQGELLHIFLDHRPDSSFYRFDINPQGTVSVQIIHDQEGKITGVAYMTEEEVAELMGELYGEQEEEIPAINIREWGSSELLAIQAEYKTDNIYILPSPTDNIILKEYLTEDKSSYYADAKITDNVLTIRSGDRPVANYKSYIEIYIPDAALEDVAVNTVSGAIEVDSYTGVVTLSTTSGSIDVLDSDIAGRVSTVSGAVGLLSSGASGDLYVSSHSGQITAYFSDSASYVLNAKTFFGKIKSSYFGIQPEDEKAFSWVAGNVPKSSITLETFSGNIEID